MAKVKGSEKSGGRKKGTPNKDNELKAFIRGLISDNTDKLTEEIKKLEGKVYVDAVMNMMEYAVPKLQRVELDADIDVKAEGFVINYIKPEKK